MYMDVKPHILAEKTKKILNETPFSKFWIRPSSFIDFTASFIPSNADIFLYIYIYIYILWRPKVFFHFDISISVLVSSVRFI